MYVPGDLYSPHSIKWIWLERIWNYAKPNVKKLRLLGRRDKESDGVRKKNWVPKLRKKSIMFEQNYSGCIKPEILKNSRLGEVCWIVLTVIQYILENRKQGVATQQRDSSFLYNVFHSLMILWRYHLHELRWV